MKKIDFKDFIRTFTTVFVTVLILPSIFLTSFFFITLFTGAELAKTIYILLGSGIAFFFWHLLAGVLVAQRKVSFETVVGIITFVLLVEFFGLMFGSNTDTTVISVLRSVVIVTSTLLIGPGIRYLVAHTTQ